jgi:hypothetical protein
VSELYQPSYKHPLHAENCLQKLVALQLNSYPQGFNNLVINSMGGNRPSEVENPLGSVNDVNDVSVKFKCIGD